MFKLIQRFHPFKRNISALYITGDKASEVFSVLNPYIDFDERLKNKQELVNNLELRQIKINLDEVIRLWNFYKHLESKKSDLEESRSSISRMIVNLEKRGDKYAEKINSLKAHGKMVKEDLKVFKESFFSVEEKAVIQALKIPNYLHLNTPKSEIKIVHSFLNRENTTQEIIADLVEFKNSSYYLKKTAALFDLYSSFYLHDELIGRNYVPFSNSHFARSVIVDGVGDCFYDKTLFSVVEDDVPTTFRLHLVGGASLASFMAFYCKHTIHPTQFPLRYFTTARKYKPSVFNQKTLLDVPEETAAQIFVATKDDASLEFIEFERILRDVIEIYETLNHHFRVCFLTAPELKSWESLRASFQMFSPQLNTYVETGNISLCGNYISKRLLFNYGRGNLVNYPRIVTGTILSVPKLLACFLPTKTDETLLPDVFRKYC